MHRNQEWKVEVVPMADASTRLNELSAEGFRIEPSQVTVTPDAERVSIIARRLSPLADDPARSASPREPRVVRSRPGRMGRGSF